MIAWLDAMTPIQQLFAYIALGGTFALLIQLGLLIAGFGGDGDADTDAPDMDFDLDGDGIPDFDLDLDGDGIPDHLDAGHVHGPGCGHEEVGELGQNGDALRPFTVRGLTAFAAIFGWAGLILLKLQIPSFFAAAIGAAAGLAAMVLMAMAMRAMYSMQTSGNIDIRNARGQEATVYLAIPPKRTAPGKVNLILQERYCELGAVTDWPEPIKAGARVVVVGAEGDAVVVAPYKDTNE